jgi:hypothetical protein
MNCGVCGEPNDDNAYKCIKCGRLLHWNESKAPSIKRIIPNYLVQSILVTIFCCLPFGIVALVYSNRVSTNLIMGNQRGAIYASKQARTWCWISLGMGLVLGIIGLIVRLHLLRRGHQFYHW